MLGEEKPSRTEKPEGPAGPSLGPHTDLSHFRQLRRGPAPDVSKVDAMGRDKHRQIVGGTYGPTRRKLALLWGGTIAVIAAISFGLYLLAKDIDQPPEKVADEAPWSVSDAQQRPPKPLQ